MAIYIINSRVVFDDQSGSLSIIDDHGDPIILAAPASRLLSLLIKKNNKVLTRDEILTEVWEKHGLVASNNNLYHYISVIRKSLSSLGKDNIIVTLPKIGFSMKAVSIVVQSQEQSLATPHIDDVLDKRMLSSIKFSEIEPSSTQPCPGLPRQNKIIVVSIVLILFFTVLIAAVLSYTKKNRDLSENQPSAKIESCSIYPLKKNQTKSHDIIVDEIKSRLEKFKLDCSKSADIYYSNEKGYKLIYFCEAIAQNIPNPQHCYNIIVDDEVSL